MGKYYVLSGQVRRIIAAPHITDSKTAAIEACLQHSNGLVIGDLAPLIIVSERGFDFNIHEQSEDTIFSTVDILTEAGLLNG
jgi:hypothetical protein